MEWVFVEDRLPEKDGYYIVVEAADHLVLPQQRQVGFSFYDIDEKEWGDVIGIFYRWALVKREYDKVKFSVLWWMPLPGLPTDCWPEMKGKIDADRNKSRDKEF